MNTSYRPQSRLMYQMPTSAIGQLPSSSRRTALSARQLVDVELGLFLLAQLQPTAPPDALPNLLTGDPASLRHAQQWTAKQHRYLNRARLLLGHFGQQNTWLDQLDRYSLGPQGRKAYILSPDRTHFTEKSLAFSRERVTLLRQMLG